MLLEQNIQRVEEKLHLLLKKLQQVQAENATLREEVRAQHELIGRQQENISGLEDRLRLMKIAATAQGAPASAAEDQAFRKEIRSRINDYIREIDRCIALLNG